MDGKQSLMENSSNTTNSVFTDTTPPKPCSGSLCKNGHTWKPTLALARCEGCGGDVLLVKLENCPFCNEPSVRFGVRVDFIPTGAGVAKRCLGQHVHGESVDVDMERQEMGFVREEKVKCE